MEQLKKLKKIRLIGIIMSLSAIPLFILVGNIQNEAVLVTLAWIIILMFIVGVIIIFSIEQILKRYCKKCGASMKGAAYEYEESSRYTDNNGTTFVHVAIEGTCSECGHVKPIYKKFRATGANLDRKARKTAEKYFR